LQEAQTVRSRIVPAVSIAALAVAFAIDLITPQLFVAAILLDAPIVLSSLGGSRRFTYWLVAAALAANVVAGYVNGVQDHHHWDSIGIGDRILAGLSIVFVGYLSTTVQENAQRVGRLAAQESRARRETLLAASIERVRSLLSLDLVLHAIARETTALLDVTQARFVLTEGHATTLVAYDDREAVDLDDERPSPEVASLVQRTLDAGDVVVVRQADALGRLVLDTLGAPAALALPIVDRDRRFGVVIALGRNDRSFEDMLPLARAYAAQSANALAQARLFAQLAERNDALEERSAVIRDLVYALSHDLRTPLAALGMTLRQAQAGAYGELPAPYREILARSIVATDDVQRLAETLLLVARFESGDRIVERQRVDLAELVRQIAGELEALARARGITLAFDDRGPAETIGDRGDLRRAIVNLVGNALEHTPEGGTVTTTVAAGGDQVTIRVDDDGFGVSDAARPHLFTRFAPGEGRRGGGSGLGLYIVRRVAEECGGTVTYAPRDPRGSAFTITLPRANRAG
jgi:signal transduction histidine kinase